MQSKKSLGYEALKLVDFHPVPHHTNIPFKKAAQKIIDSYGDTIKLYPISNAQAIVVQGDTVEKASK